MERIPEDRRVAREWLKKRLEQGNRSSSRSSKFLKFHIKVLLYHAFPKEDEECLNWEDAVKKAVEDAAKEGCAVPRPENCKRCKRTTWAMAQAYAWLKQHKTQPNLTDLISDAHWMFLFPFESKDISFYKYLKKMADPDIKQAAIDKMNSVVCVYLMAKITKRAI